MSAPVIKYQPIDRHGKRWITIDGERVGEVTSAEKWEATMTDGTELSGVSRYDLAVKIREHLAKPTKA
jgi:CMP-2-keto-3-deoxyoctulosonic acid synthetase